MVFYDHGRNKEDNMTKIIDKNIMPYEFPEAAVLLDELNLYYKEFGKVASMNESIVWTPMAKNTHDTAKKPSRNDNQNPEISSSHSEYFMLIIEGIKEWKGEEKLATKWMLFDNEVKLRSNNK